MIRKTTTPFRFVDRAPSRVGQIVLAMSGILFVITSLLLLLAPRWFFDHLGNFPPYNRHYEGDLGAFLLPIGVGLLYSARNPAKNRGIIAVAAGGSLLHVLNHIFDGVAQQYTMEHWLVDSAPLVVAVLLLLVALGESKS